MKRNFNFILAAAAAFAMVLSCSKVEELGYDQNSGSESLGQISISATLSDALTKVAFTPSYGQDGKPSQLALAWEANDKLRVYDNADKTKYEDFSLDAASVGKKTGTFTGNIFAAESYYVEVVNGDVAYAEQTQPADGVTTSLKYLASASGVTSLSEITFTDYSSVLAITAKMPEGAAAGVASVELSASEAIFSTGKTLKIQLAQVGDAGEDDILNLFATLPVGNQQIAEGTTLLVTFNAPDTDHTVYTRFVELGSQTFTAGKLNTININATQSDKHAGLISCDGSSAEKAYLIGDKYQMQAMGGLMTADATTYFKMVADVDLAGVNWTPLGGLVSLDGNSKTINNIGAPVFDDLNGAVSNLTISGAKVSSANTVGILANTVNNSATVSEVTVRNSQLASTATEAGKYVGGLVGVVAAASTFVDCHIEGLTLTGPSAEVYVGGAFGYINYDARGEEAITRCSVKSSTLTASNYSGGFIGVLEADVVVKTIEVDCDVTAKSTIGGAVAYLVSGTLDGVAASGDVDGKQAVGGLVGRMNGGAVKNCSASGKVSNSGSYYVGGLVGRLQAGSVKGSYATGDLSVSNNNYTHGGGLIGNIVSGTVEECYATGNVTSSAKTNGGLVGSIEGDVQISKCYATGDVKGGQRLGSMVGAISAGTIKIENCYTSGTLTGSSYVGFMGYVSGGTTAVNKSYTNAINNGTHETSAAVFAGTVTAANLVTCSGFIGWNVTNKTSFCYTTNVQPDDDDYVGTEGTISSHARTLGYDETIWDLSGEEPRLRP